MNNTRGGIPGAAVIAALLVLAITSGNRAQASAPEVAGVDAGLTAQPWDSTPPPATPAADKEGPAASGNTAVAAAVADGLTTHVALAAGATEVNPVMPTSPLGLVAMTGMKIGLAKYAETLPEEDKRTTIKATTAVWSGAAFNNLVVLAAGASPLALLAGVLFGVSSWLYTDEKYAEEDRKKALLATSTAAAAPAVPADQPD